MQALFRPLSRSPEQFPHSYNAIDDTVTFIRLHRADFARASFLDARILSAATPAQTMPWSQVAASIEDHGIEENCDLIFHIGHVGSTLLSRLVGAHPRVFSLREPLILRNLAHLHGQSAERRLLPEVDLDDRIGGCLKLLSRTFETEQRAVVKATSFVSELAGRLLTRITAPSAVMMFVSAETYCATILAGPNSRQEARMLAPARLHRLQCRVGGEAWQLESFGEAEALALGWACEMSALADGARQARRPVMTLDFDRFLEDPETHLSAVFAHLRVDATLPEIRAILNGPDMYRYSKATEYAYDAQLRLQLLNQARAEHAAAIDRALRWIADAASRFAPVSDALQMGKEARLLDH